MGEGKPHSTGHSTSEQTGEAQQGVSQDTIHDMTQWNQGQPKTVDRDAYGEVSDRNAHAGAETPLTAQTTPDDAQPGTVDGGGRHGQANPVSYGGYRDGLPASGAATHPDKTVDADENI